MKHRAITSNRVKKYLREKGIPCKNVDGSLNVLIMQANQTSHYCVVEMREMQDDWYDRHKPFRFARVNANTFKGIVEGIDKYLRE
jgi:hypothetical protein